MKANEVPEKLYVDVHDNLSDSILYGFTEKRKDEGIEYTRTDAFIEKAKKWFNSKNGIVITDTEAFFEEFIDYLGIE